MKISGHKFYWPLLGCLLLPGCAAQLPDPSAQAPALPAPGAGPSTVSIDNFSFTPQVLMVAAGTTVTWINHDDVPHTATAAVKPRAFDSGVLDTDQAFTFTFHAPGKFEYFCTVHPHMTGTIIVK